MNGFRKIFPIFLSHYTTFFAKMAERKVVPFNEFHYQLKLMYLFQKHPVCNNDNNIRCRALLAECTVFVFSAVDF
jgi:hypothetical protein